MKQEFTITEDHLKLISELYIDEDFSQDLLSRSDKPYGNSDVLRDIAETLNWELFEDQYEEKHLSKKQSELAQKLHREMGKVVSICLKLKTFKPGKYRKTQPYGRDWKFISD